MNENTNAWPPGTLLGRLRNRDRQDLLTAGLRREFAAGEVMLRQGDDGTHCLLLLSGTVKVTATDESGYVALLDIRVGGDVIGEMAPLQGVPRMGTVTACRDLITRMLTKAELTGFLTTHPEAGIEFNSMLISRLRWANQRRIDIGACAAPARVARVLAEVARTYGQQDAVGWSLGVPLTRLELASLAGVKIATVEKTLAELDRRRAILRRGREILVSDLGRLRELGDLGPENP